MQATSPAIIQANAGASTFAMDHITLSNGQTVREKIKVSGPFLLGGRFSFTELEMRARRGWCDIDGINHAGWILDQRYFVTYDGYSQQVKRLSEVSNITYPPMDWPDRLNHNQLDVVIRFNRSIQFPRFSMEKGERWGFALSQHWKNSTTRNRVLAIETGERFDFAGGQCLAQDVDVIYIGPGNLEYSRACGYIPQLPQA